MTDQTESEHALLLRDLNAAAPHRLYGGALAERAAAALRALEAKVRRLEECNQNGITAGKHVSDMLVASCDELRADRDRLDLECARLTMDRDRLAGEVERILVQFDEAVARIKDMLEDDDGQAFKEAGKFLLRIKGRDDES